MAKTYRMNFLLMAGVLTTAPIVLADHDAGPNDTCGTATNLGETWTGNWPGETSATDWTDWARITNVYTDEEIHLTMTSGTGSHRAAVKRGSCAASFGDVLGPVETGTYWVSPFSQSNTAFITETYITTGGTGHGSYSLSWVIHPRDALIHGLEAGDSAGTATNVPVDESSGWTGFLRGSLHDAGVRDEWEAGDEDWYSFTVLPGLITVTTNAFVCSDHTIAAKLYRADGTSLIASRPPGCNHETMTCLALLPTTVVLRVHPGVGFGAYGFYLEREPAPAASGIPLCN